MSHETMHLKLFLIVIMAEHANKPLFNNLCRISEGSNLYSEAELNKLLATKVVILSETAPIES